MMMIRLEYVDFCYLKTPPFIPIATSNWGYYPLKTVPSPRTPVEMIPSPHIPARLLHSLPHQRRNWPPTTCPRTADRTADLHSTTCPPSGGDHRHTDHDGADTGDRIPFPREDSAVELPRSPSPAELPRDPPILCEEPGAAPTTLWEEEPGAAPTTLWEEEPADSSLSPNSPDLCPSTGDSTLRSRPCDRTGVDSTDRRNPSQTPSCNSPSRRRIRLGKDSLAVRRRYCGNMTSR